MRKIKLNEINHSNIDSPIRTIHHGDIIRRKPFLVKLYSEWYYKLKYFCEYKYHHIVIEIGSGHGFIKSIIPRALTSDVILLPNVNININSEIFPFKNNTLNSILMVDVFHHIVNPVDFLSEAHRVLTLGGRIVMSEPWNCCWSRFIYQNFHHEPFDPKGGWELPEGGPMSTANGALPWILFERDALLFAERFPGFEVERIERHTGLRYLMSGGLVMRQLVPTFLFPFATWLDALLAKCGIAMFAYIVIRKK